ncbi:AP-4 complex accessory subunit RUSC2 [Triplophysa rosa]|uniref:Iporin-like n=1 Tax=Triplophysa rosa TaxID=992332 RepID=A0A9W7WAL7_TRIRA|nr:AP-4 complex accessory subunit RUSC2 [Triplophysa rosa]KAI7793141.1 putative iporin-like [Triplophysa rosa]
MDVSSKPGETLFACHISQVHGQCVEWNLYSSVKTPRRPRSLNLTHSTSLPERENLPRHTLENYSVNHTCKSTETEDKKESSSTLQHFSDLSECTPLTSPERKTQSSHHRVTPRWQNLFIPQSGMNEDDEDEDSDGDNLHKYHEGSSLQLQGFNVAQSINTGSSTECRTERSSLSHKTLNYEINSFSKSNENKEPQKESATGCEDRRDRKGIPISFMDCDEQDWVDEQDYSKHALEEPDNSWAQTDNLLNCESLSQNPTDYITDSSCNSSDGVLVNFSAIYNKTNNAVPATPLNLESPDHQDGSNPMPSWSPCSVDPNSNIYPLDSDGFSSGEISDLAICLQSRAQLAGSTQNYYKLVTCDLSFQSSPNTPWSSLTSFSETHSRGSCSPPSQYFLFGQSEGEENERPKVDQNKHQGDGHTEDMNTRVTRDQFIETKEKMSHVKTHHSAIRLPEHNSCNYIKTPQSQSWTSSQKCCTISKQGVLQNSCPSHLDTNLSSHRSRQHATSFVEIAQCKKGNRDSSIKQSPEGPSGSYFPKLSSFQKENTMSFNPQNNDKITIVSLCTDSNYQSNPEGESALSQDVVRYTKEQRPTSLPIQPFVLQAPSGKQQSKTLGSLLNQYISHKYKKPGPSKATCKTKGHVQLSPVGYYSTIHLETTPSSDTCSTCTSSPVLPSSRPQCTHPCTLLGHIQQNKTPDESESPKACSSQQHPLTGKHQTYSSSFTSTKQDPNCLPEQVSLVQSQTPSVIREELSAVSFQDESYPSQHGSSPAITPVTSIPSLIYLPGNGRRSLSPFEVCTKERLGSNICHFFGSIMPPCAKKERRPGDSFSRMDRPTEESSFSPEDPSEPFSVEALHKKSMLKDLSLAVDHITAHFSSIQEPEEKIRLGNSSLCSSIRQLVFKHLCPAIQNILQDGLKAYKLDLIIGQRRNKLWNVIEATAHPGSSTRIPDSLVSVVKKCADLSNHSTRLYVFIIELLNLRALEFWIRHLYSCADIVGDHYHQWGFISLAQRPMYGPLFQELLLLLQPLSSLPFDLDVPSKTHIQNEQKQDQTATLPHMLLAQSSQMLQMSSIQRNAESDVSRNKVTSGYWLDQTPTSACESTVCYSDCTHKKEDKETRMEKNDIPESTQRSQDDKSLSTLRWARLFGSVGGTTVGPTKAQKNISGSMRRPSEWLKIVASQVDLLAQSVWTGKRSESIKVNHDRDSANTEHILNLY